MTLYIYQARSRYYPAKAMIEETWADDQALLTNTPAQANSLVLAFLWT